MHRNSGSFGFTLIASLLLLLLLSGIALGLLMMVNTENRAGGNDLENNLAFRSAEGAIEKMTSDLASTYQNIQAPRAADITALNALKPTGNPAVTYPDYTLTPRTNPDGSLKTSYGQIKSGPNQGLYAQLLPIDLLATAQRPLGDQVSMLRTVEVALIPVFQFGVFSESDLAFFSSPKLDFAGRVHTNGDLYLGVSSGTTLTFHDKLTAYGNVVRNALPNGLAPSSAYNNDGTVNVLTASGGCDGGAPACRPIQIAEGSVVAGPTSAQNPLWPNVSKSTYNGWIIDGNYGNAGGTGVKPLSLPFVGGGAQAFEIIRRPLAADTTALASSRLANNAQIRVLLSDTQAGLHLPDWNGDVTQDIPLDNSGWTANGVAVPGVAGGLNTYLAWANRDNAFKNADGSNAKFDLDWVKPLGSVNNQWPLIGGWLLVEVQRADGLWHGVTQEWLQLGFARGLLPPANSVTPVQVHPNAILIFQMLADRDGNGAVPGANAQENTTVGGVNARWNWFPINLYDTREGEVRDWVSGGAPGGASSCSTNGVMNAVELDVRNLRRWLNGGLGGTGTLVDSNTQNGYILYFSDRRGMNGDPNNANALMGEYGFEDVINTTSNAGTPDGIAEPIPAGKKVSPEDTNGNGRLDRYGATNVGTGFSINTNTNPPDPYTTRIANCYTTGRKNRVTGARHVMKLIDASLGNVPTKPDGTGGFTVGSENPVYIQGDYNSSNADPSWPIGSVNEPAHAAAAVIADTVTLLSNQWQDAGVIGAGTRVGSLLYPTDATLYRPALTTYYRVAIASGKTLTFPHPNFANSTTYFGTDGGVHNFLRFLEDWSNDTLNYKGSMVSLFYSTYATGTFKCCNYAVYRPPNRNYIFDPLFTDPKNLPPGTPMFRDINNLSYRQDFTPH